MSSPFSFLVPCAIIAVASVPLMLKLVPPNRANGFSTRRTLADPGLWYRANRFAGFALFIASAISAAVFLSHPDYASGRSLIGLAVLVIPLLVAILASVAYVQRASPPE
jgi:hypothetical protein